MIIFARCNNICRINNVIIICVFKVFKFDNNFFNSIEKNSAKYGYVLHKMLKCLCSNGKERVSTPAIKALLQSFITIITKNRVRITCNSVFKGNACKLFVTKKEFYGEKLARNRKFYHFTSDRYSHELPTWHDKIWRKKKFAIADYRLKNFPKGTL